MPKKCVSNSTNIHSNTFLMYTSLNFFSTQKTVFFSAVVAVVMSPEINTGFPFCIREEKREFEKMAQGDEG